MSAPPALSVYQQELDDYLRSLVERLRNSADLYAMASYHLGWRDSEGRPAQASGKATRPMLCLLACEACGGRWQDALPAAAALELVHNFSLIHDDIQDRDAERRHRPTVWKLWGEAQAINAGDALLALARLASLRLIEGEVSPRAVVEAAKLLDQRTLEMVEGQVLDIAFERQLAVTPDQYLEMVEKKTGALFDAALALGALVAGAEPPLVEEMGSCGRQLGVAFQLRDDVMGVWGAPSATGKQPAADILRRKKSLPVIYAFQRASGQTLQELSRIYEKAELSEDDVLRVVALLVQLGARDYASEIVRERKAAALRELERLPLRAEAGAELRQAADSLVPLDF